MNEIDINHNRTERAVKLVDYLGDYVNLIVVKQNEEIPNDVKLILGDIINLLDILDSEEDFFDLLKDKSKPPIFYCQGGYQPVNPSSNGKSFYLNNLPEVCCFLFDIWMMEKASEVKFNLLRCLTLPADTQFTAEQLLCFFKDRTLTSQQQLEQ